MKARFALGLSLLLLASMAAGAGTRAQDPTGRIGGTLHVALMSSPNLDPLSPAAWADGNAQILDIVYDSLARLDPVTGDFIPWAANSWSYNATTGDMTVELRGDMRFADGTILNAYDIVQSFDQYLPFNGLTSRVDNDTVVFDFSGGSAGSFWTQALTAKLAWNEAGTRAYSGPFGLSSTPAPPGDLLLDASLHYWAGRPNLDQVNYTVYLDLNEAACAMLEDSGNVDLLGWHVVPNDLYKEWTNCVGFPIGTPQNRSLINPIQNKTQPWVSLAENPGTKMLTVGFNWATPQLQGTAGKPLRQAIYSMLNKQVYRLVEPNSQVAHSLTATQNLAWLDPAWLYYSDPGLAGLGGSQGTNTADPYKALVDAGFMDADGDGWREDTTGAPFQLTLASPSFDLDILKGTIGVDIRTVMANAGLDTARNEFDTWTALRAAKASNSLYLDLYDPMTTVPAYLDSNADLAAANDPDVDAHLGFAAGSTDLDTVRLHLNHVMYYATSNAVLLPLLQYNSLEVVNTQNFEGWVSAIGGVNNFWSMTSLSVPFLGPLTAEILPVDSGVTAGDAVVVAVLVEDASGISVTGATVDVRTSTGGQASALDDGAASDQTAGDGIYTVSMSSPAISGDWTITATAYADGYQSDSDTAAVAVHPDLSGFHVTTSWTTFPVNASTPSATLSVVVRDGDILGPTVANVTVTAALALPGGVITPVVATTNAAGAATFTFTADVDQRTFFSVTLQFSRAGFVSATKTTSVIADPTTPQAPTVVNKVESVPGLESVALLAVVALLVAAVRLSRKQGK